MCIRRSPACKAGLSTVVPRCVVPLFTAIDNPVRWQQALNCQLMTHPMIEMELCQ
jgi:hypothetical protein